MPKVIWDHQARNDLYRIAFYIGREKGSVQGAHNLIDSIVKKCREYAKHPELGEARPELGENIRIFPCGTKSNPRNWVVIYRPMDEGIQIVRLFHGAQDYPSLLGG